MEGRERTLPRMTCIKADELPCHHFCMIASIGSNKFKKRVLQTSKTTNKILM